MKNELKKIQDHIMSITLYCVKCGEKIEGRGSDYILQEEPLVVCCEECFPFFYFDKLNQKCDYKIDNTCAKCKQEIEYNEHMVLFNEDGSINYYHETCYRDFVACDQKKNNSTK